MANAAHLTCDLGGIGVRLGIGVLVVGQSMIFGLALNLHDDVPPQVRDFTQWLLFASTMLVVLLLGGPLVYTAARELRRGRLTIESLFLLTMTGALVASLQAQFTGRGKIYFEVVSVLLVVYTFGKVIGSARCAVPLAASPDKPSSMQARADRLGRWFLPLVVFTALGTFAYWTFFTPLGWEVGLFNAMSVLLVACPCVIGLATPVVVASATSRLAERGVIVRNGDDIERLAALDPENIEQAEQLCLSVEDLHLLPWAVALCRDAVRAVRWNLARAVAYNLIGMTLAASGVLHPVVAALLMVVSSLTLMFSSTRVGQCREFPIADLRLKIENERKLVAHSDGDRDKTAIVNHKSTIVNRSRAHALAFALQGPVFLLLLPSLREPLAATLVLAGFAIAGSALAVAWHRYAIPHWLDMCLGMLAFGNLGMLLGWWVDNGFAALHGCGCCKCVEMMRDGTMKPWMWVGMLALANLAMSRTRHTLAMLSGGNVGMVLGMVAGGWCAAQIATANMTVAVAASFASMTIGMLAGMLAGTWLTESAITLVRAVNTWPK